MNLFNMEQYKKLTSEELLKKYNVVVYEMEDIEKLNQALSIIKEVLEKYGRKLQS